MSKTVKLKKGLDIKLAGSAEKIVIDMPLPKTVALKPADFHGMMPKMVIKEGERVLAGAAVFYDKYRESIKCVSPVSGTVRSIIRGDKRKILEVLIDVDSQIEYAENSGPIDVAGMDGAQVKEILLEKGLWLYIKQRPIDVVADPAQTPKAIFISGFDSAPLAADLDFILHGRGADFQAGVDVLKKLTSGNVNISINSDAPADAAIANCKNVVFHKISGPHPAGNVGTQIHHISPINKGEFIFTVNAQDVALIGRYFNTGKYDATRLVALTGSEIKNPKYYRLLSGSNIHDLLTNNLKQEHVRVISGNVLTGDKIDKVNGYLGFYHNQITVIPEGDQYKFFLTKGWLGPGFDKFSNSRLFPTFLVNAFAPNKKYVLDTNLNGEERAFVVTGELEKVFPFDILPMQLVKAAITDDIDAMESLGIYEVAPEDFALCEYVCTTKINIQDKIRRGLDLIQQECM